ncbi:DUF2953 domain-containing protein [Virgibacillus oceani]
MVWFIFGITGFLIFILLSHIYISFKLLYTDQEHYFSITIKLFRIRMFKKSYPLVPENINLSHSNPEFENFSSKLHKLLESVKLFKQTLTIILKKLKLHELNWVTSGGTGDAATTGITAGGIWSIKGMIAGLFGNFTQVKCEPVIRVNPDYQKLYFRSTLDCMVSIQIVQAIHIIIKIFRLFFSVKPEKTVSAS